MKNFQKILLSIGLACGAGACGIAALSVLAILALSFGSELPFDYFQYLNAPMLAVTLPVVAMLALLPFALRLAFAAEKAAPASDVVEIEAQRVAVEEEYDEFHLKAA
jgi:hypothetical protein